jgi:transcriptional regulator with XRE-family HTH domain
MDTIMVQSNKPANPRSTELIVGRRLKEIRSKRSLSLRALATSSGLNVNTLSLIENGKISPSVGTLQQLALALDVPIHTFFESAEPAKKSVVFTPVGQEGQAAFNNILMENLAKDLIGKAVQPFKVTLKPGTGSGGKMIVHTGYEFVYCLLGSIRYEIEKEVYDLKPGDSLVFEARLPHCWENAREDTTQILLIFLPIDQPDEAGRRHFQSN